MKGPSLPLELQGGNADAVSISLESLILSDGTSVEIPRVGVTVVVGANNVGKSTLLRETNEALGYDPSTQSANFRLLSRPNLNRSGSAVDVLAWLAERVPMSPRSNTGPTNGFVAVGTGNQGMDPRWLQGQWEWLSHPSDRLGPFHRFFVHYLTAEARIGQISPQQRRDDFTEPPTQPMHFLEDNPEQLRMLQTLSERIFQQTLTLDWLSNHVRLRVGKTSVQAPPVDAVNPEYHQSLAELPNLMDQGDGMRSVFGLLIPLIIAARPITIIDEPEAFLHPPQAAALGRILGELAAENHLQIIVATHDRNVLTGLLQSEADISVVRLDRQENSTRAYQLDPAELRALWDDPVLRYSNVLDGLFHRLVVLTEADQDCRFYAAALEHASTLAPLRLASSDVLFVPSGGKAGLPKLAKALKAVQAPVVASPDLDILNNDVTLHALVNAFHGEWDRLDRDYKVATNQFRQPKAPRTVQHVCDAIAGALRDHVLEQYTSDHRKLVQGELYVESPFHELKSRGEKAFDRGQAAGAAARLLQELGVLGIVPVRVGELENFAPFLEVGKGPEWLPAALEAGAHRDQDVQDHIQRILAVHAPTL